MKLATSKIISRFPSSLKLACIDPRSKIKHQLFPSSPQHHKAGNISCRRELLDSGDNSGQLLIAAGELSDGRSRGSVPKGFLVVLVGPEFRRFVIPLRLLAMPDFRVLLETGAEEFGCEYDGAIEIPCDEEHFEEILMTCLARHHDSKMRCDKIFIF